MDFSEDKLFGLVNRLAHNGLINCVQRYNEQGKNNNLGFTPPI